MELIRGIIEDKKKSKVRIFYDMYISKDKKDAEKDFTKKRLAYLIYEGFFENNKILEVFVGLSNSDYKLLYAASENSFGLTKMNFLLGGKFDDLMLGRYDEKSSLFFIYDEVRDYLLYTFKNEVKEDVIKKNWILRCIYFCEHFYQYTPLGIFMRLVRQNKNIYIGKEDVIKLFNEINKRHLKSFYDEKAKAFFTYSKGEKDLEYYEVFEIQKDKDFYIPSKEEIDEFYEKKYIRNDYFDMLFDKINSPNYIKDVLRGSMYKDLIEGSSSAEDYLDIFVDIDDLKCNEEYVEMLKVILKKIDNTTRKKCFRGHTRSENKTISRNLKVEIPEGDSIEAKLLRKAMCTKV